MRTLLGRACCVLLLSACADATTGPGTSPVAGVWAYDGTQEVPMLGELDGVLELQGVGVGSNAFEGTFAIDERPAFGGARRVTGTLGGILLSDSVADFDLLFGGATRRHVGVLRGDSITGSWSVAGGGATASGMFVLRRREGGAT